MVRSCAAVNCTQRDTRGVAFFRFPVNPLLRKKWIIAMRRGNWQPTQHSLLCEKHFSVDDFTGVKRRRLKPETIPSKFSIPSHLIPKACNERFQRAHSVQPRTFLTFLGKSLPRRDMSKLRSILIDLSGTIHVDNEAIPGAVEALKRLRKADVSIKFVTNTTKECRRILHERLTSLGFELDVNEIWSSLWAANDLVTSQNLRPYLIIDEAAKEDFKSHLKVTSDYNAVVVGLAPDEFHYENLNNAFRLLLSGAKLIAIHQARYFKRPDGLALGPGMFVKGFEYAADCKAEVVGKPSVDFFKTALGNVNPASAMMIGDDVRDDIEGAQKLGMRGILVQTGKYRSGDETKISPPPSQVKPSFSEAVDYILGELNKSTVVSS